LKYPLKPSLSLQHPEAQKWLEDSAEAIKLVNRALELAHPHLFKRSSGVQDQLKILPLTKEWASKWESVSTCIAVIANRISKDHRDYGGEPGWYDFLLTLGSYSQATLKLEELGVELMYKPGTSVAFCANVFRHGVGEWGEGDRLCYSFFNKSVVLDRFGKGDEGGWMKVSDLINLSR